MPLGDDNVELAESRKPLQRGRRKLEVLKHDSFVSIFREKKGYTMLTCWVRRISYENHDPLDRAGPGRISANGPKSFLRLLDRSHLANVPRTVDVPSITVVEVSRVHVELQGPEDEVRADVIKPPRDQETGQLS